MYLKSIEIQGFKSFARKTLFQFHNGITGIVGPNGSGKSNVADAVRWVLGEQSAKQLRGGSMQDVIFAGTASRKPLGYAAVDITLDNSDHVLPVPYDEVTVSRRLYRSGESEYLLNGTAVRLKDINEIFYDTGIGKEGYSIIGQGQIDQILSGKPEDRRELFDEAAGIVKFKRRKAEAQKKLENEQASLLRVNDILSELTRQLGPLEKASEKAKIYLKKKEELKAYDVNLFLTEIGQLKEKLAQAKENFVNASGELKQVNEQAQRIRSEYEEESAALDSLQARQDELSTQISAERLSKADLEHKISLVQAQITADREKEKQNRSRSGAICAETQAKNKDLENVSHSLKDMELSGDDLAEQYQQLEQRLHQLQEQIRKISRDSEEIHQAQIDLLSERTSIRASEQKYQTMLEQAQIERARRSSQILTLKSEEGSSGSELDRLKTRRDDLASQVQTLSDQSGSADRQLAAYQDQLTQYNRQMETDQAEYHREASRLESLKGIAERYDGYGNSIRRVMELKGKERGLHGVVADLISTQDKYETAIETALGGSIQNIVTDDEETARRMIAYLKENRYGRATFLPLTAMKKNEPFKPTSVLSEEGVIGVAKTLVTTKPQYAGLAAHLLGRTVVCDQIDHAIALQKKYRYSLRIVTLGGESLSPGGSMTGGAFKNSSNLLGRRREIEQLEEETGRKAKALEQLREKTDQCRLRRNELRERIRQISDQLQKLYLLKNTADLQYQQRKQEQDQIKERWEKLQSQQAQAADQTKELETQRQEAAALLAQSQQSEQSLKEKEKALHDQADGLTQEEERVSSQLADVKAALSASEQKKNFLEAESRRLHQELEQLAGEAKALEEGRDQAQKLEQERQEQIRQLEEEARRKDSQIGGLEEETKNLAQEKERISSRQKTFFDQREELTKRSSLLDKECFRLNAQIEKMEENRDSRISYMWEEYELTYNNALALKREDLGSVTAWRRNMSTLRKEIRDLGSVNVNAIEEYKEVSERHDFLSGQQEDLIKAEKALEKIISRLDEDMRRQFRQQFANIAAEFDKAFRELFGGGAGTLELTDQDNVLESGIRIIAQPPGKKLQNMMQLSGGEKSLTAIALLFAIQNLKPSPFCLLDEIEAALDENNVQRYAAYLRKLTKHTQFIIITHRRGTMAAADRLYGVTMQEKGVSALVSVNLIENDLDA